MKLTIFQLFAAGYIKRQSFGISLEEIQPSIAKCHQTAVAEQLLAPSCLFEIFLFSGFLSLSPASQLCLIYLARFEFVSKVKSWRR
jgi:hypothetical protein